MIFNLKTFQCNLSLSKVTLFSTRKDWFHNYDSHLYGHYSWNGTIKIAFNIPQFYSHCFNNIHRSRYHKFAISLFSTNRNMTDDSCIFYPVFTFSTILYICFHSKESIFQLNVNIKRNNQLYQLLSIVLYKEKLFKHHEPVCTVLCLFKKMQLFILDSVVQITVWYKTSIMPKYVTKIF